VAGIAARKHLVVKIKVRCAANVCITAILCAVPGSHRVDSFTGHILVITAPVVSSDGICFEVDLWADGVAVLVMRLAVLVVAILSATFCKQFLLGWLGQEDIHIALDLLSGGPIDLAILLQALLGLVGSVILSLASCPATVVVVLAIQVVASFVCAIGGLAFCLHAVASGIHLDVRVVSSNALRVQRRPLSVRILKLADLELEPVPEGRIHSKVGNLARAKATAVPGGVIQNATFLGRYGAILLEFDREIIQSSTMLDVRMILDEEHVSALLVRLPITILWTAVTANLLLLLTALEAEDSVVELHLIIAMSLVQSGPDVSQQLLLDDLKRSRDITVQLVVRILLTLSKSVLHEVLKEGRHLRDIAAAHSVEKVVYSCLKRSLHLHVHGQECGSVRYSTLRHDGQRKVALHVADSFL
jgi:hypothetical protein